MTNLIRLLQPWLRRESKLVPAAILTGTVLLFGGGRPPAAPVVELKSPAGPGSGEPNLVVAPDGRAFLSWLEPAAPRGHALRFSVRGPQGWSAPKTIARGTNWFANPADFPSMSVMADGTLAAHWLVMSGGADSEAYDINIAFSKDAGATWSKPVVPHRDGKKRQHGFLSLVPTADGKLGAIWLDGRNMPDEAHGNMALMHTSIAANGVLGSEAQIDNRVCECCQTSMTATPDGLVAVYRDRSDKEIRDISMARYTNGRWSPPEDLSKDGWEIDGCPINGPEISSNGRNVAVAWFTAPDDKPAINLVMSADSGKTFGKKIQIDAGNPAGRVDVVSLPSGEAVVSWIERVAQGPQVHLRRVAANGTPSAPVNASATASVRSGGFPRIVLSGNEIVAAWTDSSEPSQVRTAVISF
jgi:hypothetical protein